MANKHTDNTHTHSSRHTLTHTGHIHCVSFEPHIECKWRKFKLQTNNFRKMCDVNFVSHFFCPFLAIPLAPACHTPLRPTPYPASLLIACCMHGYAWVCACVFLCPFYPFNMANGNSFLCLFNLINIFKWELDNLKPINEHKCQIHCL